MQFLPVTYVHMLNLKYLLHLDLIEVPQALLDNVIICEISFTGKPAEHAALRGVEFSSHITCLKTTKQVVTQDPIAQRIDRHVQIHSLRPPATTFVRSLYRAVVLETEPRYLLSDQLQVVR